MDDIRDIRSRLGLTQIEFADKLGLHQSTISRLESGDLPVDKRTSLAVQALIAAADSAAAGGKVPEAANAFGAGGGVKPLGNGEPAHAGGDTAARGAASPDNAGDPIGANGSACLSSTHPIGAQTPDPAGTGTACEPGSSVAADDRDGGAGEPFGLTSQVAKVA